MPDSIPAPKKLEDSRIIVSGGTSGVGLATAKLFARRGVSGIVVMGRNRNRGKEAIAELKKESPSIPIEYISVDANDVRAVEEGVATAVDVLGGIDVLVNSTAASYVPKLLFNTDLQDIQSILTEQALSQLLMSRAVLPWLREQKSGVILNIASDAAKFPTPGETIIGAAMAAIVTFSKTLAVEAKRDGIRVNVLTPSLIAGTNVYSNVMDDPFSAKLFENAAKAAHLGVAEPIDLAEIIVFLASPAARRITGQTISVNGGISTV